MHTITDNYDVAIIDIPYGLYSPTTVEEQTAIINTARKIAKKLLIITCEDMDDIITNCGFTIYDRCCIAKNNFKRYITLCI